MKILIIIATYNATSYIDRCITCIPSRYDVLVVDNASEDKTTDRISQNYAHVKLLNQPVNLGFGAANNIGIRYAIQHRYDAVFLLNQDAYLFDNTIETIIYEYKKNPQYGLLSPVHVTCDGETLENGFLSNLSYNFAPADYLDLIKTKKKPVVQVDFVNAAGWFIPVSTIIKVGGFDPIFFHYGEDDNYIQRLHFHGIKIGVVTAVRMIHDTGIRTLIPSTDLLHYRNESRFKAKFANLNTDALTYRFPYGLFKEACFNLSIKNLMNIFRYHAAARKWYQDCTKSKHINRVEGTHYL